MLPQSDLWVDKSRPSTIDDYAFPEDGGDLRTKLENWIATDIPHLLLEGRPGTGKTSLANVIISEKKVTPGDLLFINSSRERKPDDLEEKLNAFLSTYPIGDRKYVILDECLSEHEKIRMVDGSFKALSEFELGKRYEVLSVDMFTGAVEHDYATVISDKLDLIYRVTLDDGRTISTTFDHPFLVYVNGIMIQRNLCDINIGSKIVALDNDGNTSEAVVSSINGMGEGRVINLSVRNNHTFITENGIATHNCDVLTPLMQNILKGMIEQNSNTARFILTCNRVERIDPALISRCSLVHFDELSETEFKLKVAKTLAGQNISFDMETLEYYYTNTYPDLRKCISLMQDNSVGGSLKVPRRIKETTSDFLKDAIPLIRSGKATAARKLLANNVAVEEYQSIFEYLYKNVNIFGDDELTQNQAVLIIADAVYKHSMVATLGDPEINMAAMLVQLCELFKE